LKNESLKGEIPPTVSGEIMAESIRARAEEFRTRVQAQVAQLRSGAGLTRQSPPEILTDIRQKGLLPTIQERAAKIRGGSSSSGGILQQFLGKPTTTLPPEEDESFRKAQENLAKEDPPITLTAEMWAKLSPSDKQNLLEEAGVSYEATKNSLKHLDAVELATPGKYQRGRVAVSIS